MVIISSLLSALSVPASSRQWLERSFGDCCPVLRHESGAPGKPVPALARQTATKEKDMRPAIIAATLANVGIGTRRAITLVDFAQVEAGRP
jgi:hypothetical protein